MKWPTPATVRKANFPCATSVQGCVLPYEITGTVTQICVEETAREAFHRGYKTTIVADAVSSYMPDLHEATLKNFRLKFGWVSTASEVIEEL